MVRLIDWKVVIKRTVIRPQIAQKDEANVGQSPNAQPSECDDFDNREDPIAQVKSIRPKTSKEDAKEKSRGPPLSGSEIARELLLEIARSKTEGRRGRAAVCQVSNVSAIARNSYFTLLKRWIKLPAIKTFVIL